MSIIRADKKIPAGLLAIFLGEFGIHKFFLGYPRAGAIMLGLYLLGWATVCVGGGYIIGALHLIGIVEGLIYLFKSDTDFYRDYIIGRKQWF